MNINKMRHKVLKGIAIVLLSSLFCSGLAHATEPFDTRTDENNAMSTEAAYELTVDSNEWTNWPEGPKTYGEADIIMDAETGAILYAKNIDGKAYPASITKVLTLLFALENGNMQDMVTFSSESVNSVPYGYAHIGMKVGEGIILEDALYGMMLASANEVAHSIAESVGQNLGHDYDWAIQQMNVRVKELGAVNSNFVNANGLDDEEHYTTARDMALITQELLLNHPEFQTICQTLQYRIDATNMVDVSRTFQQNHKMFYEAHKNYDERVIAGKTGYTDAAKNTLVTCADDGNMKIICVALKTHGQNVYNDTDLLLDYAYDNFEHIDVSTLEKSEDIKAFTGNTLVTVPKGVTFEQLSTEFVENKTDATIGNVVYSYNGNVVGETEIEFTESYIKENHPQFEKKNKKEEAENNGDTFRKIVVYTLYVIILIIVLLFTLLVFLIYLKKKRARERRRRRQAEMRRRRMMEERGYYSEYSGKNNRRRIK